MYLTLMPSDHLSHQLSSARVCRVVKKNRTNFWQWPCSARTHNKILLSVRRGEHTEGCAGPSDTVPNFVELVCVGVRVAVSWEVTEQAILTRNWRICLLVYY